MRQDVDAEDFEMTVEHRVGVLRGVATMLWTIALLLVILWFFGYVSSYTLGGFIHILLLLAVVAVLVRIIQGRRAL